MNSSSTIIKDIANHWPKLATTYHYHFITENTVLEKINNGWQKTIERKVEIIFLGRKDGYRLFQVLTTKITITSNKGVSNKRMYLKLGYVFDYLEVGVSDSGRIIKVFNLKELLLRFTEIKTELKKDYIGTTFEQLLSIIEVFLKEEEKLITFLHSYKMFGLYFNGLYQPFQRKRDNPIIRQKILDDFEQIEIQETFTYKEKDNFYDYHSEKTNEDNLVSYKGIFKTEYNQIIMGYIEIENEIKNVKHNISWVG
jgi:hypothetical protein